MGALRFRAGDFFRDGMVMEILQSKWFECGEKIARWCGPRDGTTQQQKDANKTTVSYQILNGASLVRHLEHTKKGIFNLQLTLPALKHIVGYVEMSFLYQRTRDMTNSSIFGGKALLLYNRTGTPRRRKKIMLLRRRWCFERP
jgi:hypothetical protein